MTESLDLEADEQDDGVEEKEETTSNSEGGGCFFLLALIVAFVAFAMTVSHSHKSDIARIKEETEEKCNRKWVETLLKIPYEGQRQPLIASWAKPDEVQRRVEKIIWK
jgi:hypothetical protein